jgi:hypothetical protein
MKVGRLLVLGITLIVLFFPLSHQALGQDGSTPTPSPNAPVADYLVYLPLVVKQNTPQQPGSSHPRTIDHRSVDLFSRIPEQYLTAARNIRMLFRPFRDKTSTMPRLPNRYELGRPCILP